MQVSFGEEKVGLEGIELILKSLTLRNFTAFAEAEFKFAPHLNVIIGENGAGKTHISWFAHLLSG